MKCTFCGTEIARGTGKMYVQNDGKILYLCSKKCEKHIFKLKHAARSTRWTEAATIEKKMLTHGAKTEKAAEKAAKKAVKK